MTDKPHAKVIVWCLSLMFTLVFAIVGGNALAKDLASVPVATETTRNIAEFEGRYQVGKTICTVKPIKMAFELKWAKGKGVMHFFYDRTTAEGKPIFVTEDRSKGQDKFIFDDDRYNTGQFIRADGKTFAVRRSK